MERVLVDFIFTSKHFLTHLCLSLEIFLPLSLSKFLWLFKVNKESTVFKIMILITLLNFTTNKVWNFIIYLEILVLIRFGVKWVRLVYTWNHQRNNPLNKWLWSLNLDKKMYGLCWWETCDTSNKKEEEEKYFWQVCVWVCVKWEWNND